ncbi:B22R family protein [Salmon gill poxvirus]
MGKSVFFTVCLFMSFGHVQSLDRLDPSVLQEYVDDIDSVKISQGYTTLLGITKKWVDTVVCANPPGPLFESEFRDSLLDHMLEFMTVSITQEAVEKYISPKNSDDPEKINGLIRSEKFTNIGMELLGKVVALLDSYNCTHGNMHTTKRIQFSTYTLANSQKYPRVPNMTVDDRLSMTQLKRQSINLCLVKNNGIPESPITDNSRTLKVAHPDLTRDFASILFYFNGTIIEDVSEFEETGKELIRNITRELLDYVTESRNKDAMENMTATEELVLRQLRYVLKQKIDKDVMQIGLEPLDHGGYVSLKEFFQASETSWRKDVWTHLKDNTGADRNLKIASVVFGALSSVGSTMVIGGATMGPVVQGIGGGILGVGQLGSTAITLFEMFKARPDVRDINTEFWVNYKQFIDSPAAGVRKCMGGVDDNTHIQMAYRSEMNDKAWMDAPKSIVVIQKNVISHDMSNLFVECFSGKLRMTEGNIDAFSNLVMSKDGRQLYRVDYSGLSKWWDRVSLTCGKEITLEIEFTEAHDHMMFLPGSRTGDSQGSWTSMSDVCMTDPLKRIGYTTLGCKYDPLSTIRHETSCSLMYDMSVYDNIKHRFITVSGIFDNNQTSVKVFEFFPGQQNYTLDTTTVDGQSKCLKVLNDPDTCHWPEMVTVRNTYPNKVRIFNVKLGPNTKFGLTCTPGSQIDYNGTYCDLKQIGKETWEVEAGNCQVQCFAKGKESDIFIVTKTTKAATGFELTSRFGTNVRQHVTDADFDARTEVAMVKMNKFTVSTVVDFGENMISLRSGNNTWKDMVLSVYGCPGKSEEDGKCTHLMNGTWTRKHLKYGFGEVSDSLTFEFENVKLVSSCSATVRLSDQLLTLACTIKDFDHSHVMVTLETGVFFCDQDTQDRTCDMYNNGDVISSKVSQYVSTLTTGKLYGIISDVISGTQLLGNGMECMAGIKSMVNTLSGIKADNVETMIRNQIKTKCGNTLIMEGALPTGSWCCNSQQASNNRPISWKPLRISKFFDVIDLNKISYTVDPVKIDQDVYQQILSLKQHVRDIENGMSDLKTMVSEYSSNGIVTLVTMDQISDDYENHEMYKNEMVNKGLTKIWHGWLNITSTLTGQTWTDYVMERDYVCCGWNGTTQEVINIYGDKCEDTVFVYQTRVCGSEVCCPLTTTTFLGCQKRSYQALSGQEQMALKQLFEKTDKIVRLNAVIKKNPLVRRTITTSGLNTAITRVLTSEDQEVDYDLLMAYNVTVATCVVLLTLVFLVVLVVSICKSKKKNTLVNHSESQVKLLTKSTASSMSSESSISGNKSMVTV